MARHIFISYARADQPVAARIVQVLSHAGFDVWWDKRLAGEAFNAELKSKIQNAAIVLCLLSPHFLESHYCDGELSTARPDTLLPLDISEIAHSDVPIPLNRFNRLSLVSWAKGDDPDAGLALIDACRRRFGETSSEIGSSNSLKAPMPDLRPQPQPPGEGTFIFNIGEAGVVAHEISGGTINVSVGGNKLK